MLSVTRTHPCPAPIADHQNRVTSHPVRTSNVDMNLSRSPLARLSLFRYPLKPRQPPIRRLHLAPPFLVDDYVPRYLRQQYKTLERKKEESMAHLKQCNICPRYFLSLATNVSRCNVNRFERVGTCLIGCHPLLLGLMLGADAIVNTAAPHFGEESCIQGVNGSGTIFFSGCNLRCVF